MAILWFVIGLVTAFGLLLLVAASYSAGMKEGSKRLAEEVKKEFAKEHETRQSSEAM